MSWFWHRHGAPGHPGRKPYWTSGDKTGIGTAIYQHLWFTIGDGALNEIFFPRIDEGAVRDMQLIVSDSRKWISEEKRHTLRQVDMLEDGIPAYRLTNTCTEGKYRIEKEIVADPHRPVILQRIRITPLKGKLENYRLYAFLAPHLGDGGEHNTGWIGEHKGIPGLFASREGSSLPARSGAALAMISSAPWIRRSAGFVGRSDGLTDIARHKRMKWKYPKAKDGNVALTGEIDLDACKGEFVLVLAFGEGDNEAATHARTSLRIGFDKILDDYSAQWREWQKGLLPLDRQREPDKKNLYRISTMVLRAHESTSFPGALIASLSIPWGEAQGEKDRGGYHVTWPRDLVMAAGGYLAAGAKDDALRVITYLESVQEGDGHWKQCLWLDGRPYFDKIQLDETAMPILLVDLLLRNGALTDTARFWPMVRSAVMYLIKNGPATPQDRWESESGYTPFTIAAVIASLLIAADLADKNHERGFGASLRETADDWFANIDKWMYVTGNEWCEQYGIEGYYNRITPSAAKAINVEPRPSYNIKNRPKDEARHRADLIVSVDALALVRFGLRTPDDPRILNTIKVIDDLLRIETPNGTAWRRYNEDGYGEKRDGSPFDGTGLGRAWPLLAGERGHYALLSDDKEGAIKVCDAMEAFANIGGMIPEQVWDDADIPEKNLFRGQPTGSGCPLVWAHAEYIKLLRSLRDGQVFDLPPQTVQRYLGHKTDSSH